MTQYELEQLVKEISFRFFGQKFSHQVKINHRMTTTGGRYHLNDHHLEINAHFLLPQYRDELIGIIKHELTHYHLHLAGKGYHHRDRDFKVLLNQVGGYQFTPDIGLRRTKKVRYAYLCQDCGQNFMRVRRINLRRYVCGNCGGKLIQLTLK
ncbi:MULTISPECIES: SprT family protein [unclassified Lactobacillus]|uniref:SprT family protein n=1 Tax=unclassified Lactobacillus TaxID=2620435 RepID=UPI000EFA7C6E|nr:MULTISPECIES: SprT family protein [unclassified Lactobacillus]RMC24884.1 SprT family protein [Lactobacillus sp. ESL0247]RMC29038.1 SprT family protein [Lactobacillus sp. ESL0246]RMC32641.1 SprT family protein [Lactobacillus sp. ESL0245]RMC49543.1 SprT family protein [Lactobacillus sp. ESL0228]